MPFHSKISDAIVSFDLVIPSMSASTHKQFLQKSAREIAKLIGLREKILFDRLYEKEKEHMSTIGDGISLIHLPMGSLQSAINVFVRLRTACPMGAADNMDVDLVCFIITPEREGSAYLRTMARLSRFLRDAQTCSRLRSAADEKDLRHILDQSSIRLQAA